MPGVLARIVTRGRAINWVALYEAARFVYRHSKERWNSLTPAERRRLGELIRKSKGRRSNLTQAERDRLWALVKKGATGSAD
jgi:TRAP-type C4-dicarboxylate transport system substrate-binding protein